MQRLNNRRKSMQSNTFLKMLQPRPLALAALAAAWVLIPGLALADEVPLNDLYKSLAEKNYYVAVEGLTNATAQVKCNILDQVVAAFPGAADKPIAVTFSWERPSEDAWPQKSLKVTGIPADLTDLTARANLIFQGRLQQDLVLEDPVYWTIASTDATAVADSGTITVTGAARNPSDAIKKLTVQIDEPTFKVEKMTMDLGNAEASFVRKSTKQLDGKWAVDSLVVSTPQGTRTLNYEYTQVDGIWLPSKITVDYKAPDGQAPEPTFVYEFNDWKVQRAEPETAEVR